jgi:hypothetical protein
MAKHNGKCSVCKKEYTYYDTSPSLFCSVYCQLEVDSIDDSYVHKKEEKARPSITARVIKGNGILFVGTESVVVDKLRKRNG